jgi:hypothetical protein
MNASHGWIMEAIHPFQHDVASCVPPVFQAYARVFHPAYELGQPVSWNAVAQANNRTAHPAMEWGSLVGSWDLQTQRGLWDRRPDTGRLPGPTATRLSRVLRQCSRADGVLYALWNGYGGYGGHGGQGYCDALRNAELIELPNRPMFVVAGSIDDATEPFGIAGRSANLWWATDRQWCVATDIDLMTTYVGASARCVTAILDDVALEAFPVPSEQRITWDADTINPLPAPP